MTRKESVFLAKKLFTELVFNTAYIEGVNKCRNHVSFRAASARAVAALKFSCICRAVFVVCSSHAGTNNGH